MSNVPIMDEPSEKTKVHFAETYKRVIKEIENLEQFFDAKVLAAGSIFDPVVFKAKYGTRKLPWGPNGTLMHPRGPDGSRLDGESNSSDGSWFPGHDDVPDTPVPDTPEQAKRKAATMWGNAKVDKKPRWGPPTSVSGNDDYCSSVLKKDGYL